MTLPDMESRSEDRSSGVGSSSDTSDPIQSSAASWNHTDLDSSENGSDEEIDTIEVVDEYVAEVSGNVEVGGN